MIHAEVIVIKIFLTSDILLATEENNKWNCYFFKFMISPF